MNADNPFLARRIDDQVIQNALIKAKEKFVGLDGIILSDVKRPNVHVVRKPQDVPEGDEFCLLAFEQDDLCSDIIAELNSRNRKWFPCLQLRPVAEYWRTNRRARRALRMEYDEQAKVSLHRWDTGDYVEIVQALERTRNIAGAYVEVGVFKGHSARIALRYMQQARIRRTSWFLDVFIGFNYPEAHESTDIHWAGTHHVGPAEIVAEQLAEYNTPKWPIDIRVQQNNIISDPFPDTGPIAAANLDVDMYEAILAGLNKLAPRLAVGGILIVEDVGHTPALSGAFHAMSEFLASDAAKGLLPITMTSGQTFLIRTERRRNSFFSMLRS